MHTRTQIGGPVSNSALPTVGSERVKQNPSPPRHRREVAPVDVELEGREKMYERTWMQHHVASVMLLARKREVLYNKGKFPKKAEVKQMENKVICEIVEKTKQLINAPTCSSETKQAAQRWLDAVGTDKEKAETQKYIEELEADIMPIDNLIAFAQSKEGAEYFGADTAAGIAAHAQEIKAAGAKYCDCPACTIVAEILAKKTELSL